MSLSKGRVGLSKRKWLPCDSCGETWHTKVTLYDFTCNQCGSKINLIAAKRKQSSDRKAARVLKQKSAGTYKSPAVKKAERTAKRRGPAEPEYLAYVKTLRCIRPGCAKFPVDAHHSIHRSQGGPDSSAVPLCPECHVGEYHGQLGSLEAAKKDWGIDLFAESEKIYAEYSRSKKNPPGGGL